MPPNWIKALVDGYFRHPETVGVGGWYEYSDDVLQNSSYATYTTYEFKTRFPINQEIKTSHFITPVGNTSNMSYRKSALDAARGFDEEMCLPGFDDWELKIRIIDLGKPLLYLPIFVMHYHPLSTVDIAKRIFNFGRGRYKFLQKHPDLWRWYYPYFGRLMDYIIPQIPINRLDLRSMAIVQFALTRLGWEYQKIREHLTTDT
ncbi:MAG: hypothetical protein HYT98_04295 [Candidatus Sungbacteria bacterium]|nr:hypothetical protein [Candidatus Sungbacteria bacterium]